MLVTDSRVEYGMGLWDYCELMSNDNVLYILTPPPVMSNDNVLYIVLFTLFTGTEQISSLFAHVVL